MTLEIENAKLIKIYQGGNQQVKDALTELCGSEIFQYPSAEIRKKFEAACKDQGLDPNEILHTGKNINIEQIVSNSYTMLRVLAKSRKGNWEADYSPGNNQKKWRSWFEYKLGVGFVVADSACAFAITTTYVGSRFAFPTQEMAREFDEEFIELHRIVLSN